jgi:hypothetical protein
MTAWFNPAEHNPVLSGPGALVGKYPLRFTRSEQRVNQTADGASLILHYVVTGGELTNQSGSLNIKIWNKDDTAKRIAGQELSALCHVCGIGPGQLVGKPEGIEFVGRECIIEVALQKEPNPNKYTNLIGVWDMQGNLPKAGIFGATQAQAPGPQFGAPQPNPAPQFGQQPPQGYPGPAPTPQSGQAPQPGPTPSFGPGGAPAPAQDWQQQPPNTKPAWER